MGGSKITEAISNKRVELTKYSLRIGDTCYLVSRTWQSYSGIKKNGGTEVLGIEGQWGHLPYVYHHQMTTCNFARLSLTSLDTKACTRVKY
jgi:hypothetical protein